MEQSRYDFEKVSETVKYEFFSSGPRGRIRKRVIFRLTEEDPERIYNISFGDSDASGDIDDKVISNNGDSEKILHTVAATLLEFIYRHQDAWLHAEGSTPSRTRLYQMAISRYWKWIRNQFIVIGLSRDRWVPFKKGINFEAFLIRQSNSLKF